MDGFVSALAIFAAKWLAWRAVETWWEGVRIESEIARIKAAMVVNPAYLRWLSPDEIDVAVQWYFENCLRGEEEIGQ